MLPTVHTCCKCDKREGVCTPVVVVPVLVATVPPRRWPVPLYLQYKGTLCNRCAFTFTMADYEGAMGGWYEVAGDSLRSYKPPAKNPFPDDDTFKWEAFKLDPKFTPAPKDQCVVQFWAAKTLAAKSAHQRIDAHVRMK